MSRCWRWRRRKCRGRSWCRSKCGRCRCSRCRCWSGCSWLIRSDCRRIRAKFSVKINSDSRDHNAGTHARTRIQDVQIDRIGIPSGIDELRVQRDAVRILAGCCLPVSEREPVRSGEATEHAAGPCDVEIVIVASRQRRGVEKHDRIILGAARSVAARVPEDIVFKDARVAVEAY